MGAKTEIFSIKSEIEIVNQSLYYLIKKHLASPSAQTIKYEGKDRVGYERVVCGSSLGRQTSFVVRKTYHSDPTFVLENTGLRKKDEVEIIYLDRKNKTSGYLKIISSIYGGCSIYSNSEKDVSDDHIKFWDEGGALRYHPFGPNMKPDEVQKVSDILQSGIDDVIYTTKALKELKVLYPHTRVADNLSLI